MKKHVLSGIIALSLLGACTEESQTTETKSTVSVEQSANVNTSNIAQQEQQSQQSLATAVKELSQILTQQKTTLEQSIGELNSTLDQVSGEYEKGFSLSEENVNSLAKKLGKLARQAGEGAKTLEKTGKSLGEAIQKGFEEGYNQPAENGQ